MAAFARGLVEQVLAAMRPPKRPEVPEGSRINVHAAVSRFAVLYERIRNAVDYKDDHLLRGAAIKRILSRQLILEHDAVVIASNLIRELIAARYLPNNELPESLIPDASVRVSKYLAVAKTRIGNETHLDWLRSMLSVELEELFVDATQDKAFVTFLYERVADRLSVSADVIPESESRLQIYIACYRSFLKADDVVVSYKLLRAYVPEWMRPDDWLDDARAVADKLVAAQKRIRQSLRHPLSARILRAVKPWSVSLAILRDVLKEKPDEAPTLLGSPETLDPVIKRVAERRYKEANGRLRRGAVRATIYLFITKMLIAFLVEVPLEGLWYGAVNKVSLGINVMLPPLLMFVVSLFIHTPGKDNTERIQRDVGLLLSGEGIPKREIRGPRKRHGLGGLIFSLAYALMFIVTFGLIGVVLLALDFTWLSAAIFYFFLCVVSFFAFRLRQSAREYVVVEGRDRFSTVFADFVSLPILRAGQWLSTAISRINVFLFILDFLIEAPFKIFLGVLEEWFAFMKEKKDELQ